MWLCMSACIWFLFSPFQQRPHWSSAVADKECQDRCRFCKLCSAMGLSVSYCTCAIEMESESLEWEGVREKRAREIEREREPRQFINISVDLYNFILLALPIRPLEVHGQNLVRQLTDAVHCTPLAYGFQTGLCKACHTHRLSLFSITYCAISQLRLVSMQWVKRAMPKMTWPQINEWCLVCVIVHTNQKQAKVR